MRLDLEAVMLQALSPGEAVLIYGTIAVLCVMPFVVLGWTIKAMKSGPQP